MIFNFFKQYNIKIGESLWLLYVHILASIALVYSSFHPQIILKILGTHIIIHSIYCLGVTAGCHRLWSHKSYTAGKILKIFLMMCNSGMFQGSIYSWSRDHRLHHKYADTDLDPHSIQKGFFFSHVGWLLKKKSPQLIKAGKQIDLSDLTNDPIVMFQKKYYWLLAFLMTFAIPSNYAFSLAFIYSYIVPIIPAFLFSMLSYCITLNSTWCVNSICHMFGSRPWNPKILPADNYLVSIITLGQGYHNWHHQYQGDWRASKDEWYMFNPTARFIEISSLLGLAAIHK